MTVDYANRSFLFRETVSIEDSEDERRPSSFGADGSDRSSTPDAFVPSTFGFFEPSPTSDTAGPPWTTAPEDSTDGGARGGFPSVPFDDMFAADGFTAGDGLLAFDPIGVGNSVSGGPEDLLAPGEDPLEGLSKPVELPAETDSEELYKLYRNNRDLIIENNPGSGVLADFYVNPTRDDGTPKGTAILDASFLDAEPFERGIATNRSRFIQDTLSANASRIAELDVGESIVVEDHWDSTVKVDNYDPDEYDVFQSIGTATLNSQGTFRIAVTGFAEDGSREVRIDYATDHVLLDYYNWDATNGLSGHVKLGEPGEAVDADGKSREESSLYVSDKQMNELRDHGARYFPVAGVVRENGMLTGTVTTESRGFLSRESVSTLELDDGSDDRVGEVVTDPGYVLPLLEKAIELNGGRTSSVPPLTDAQRDNATVIGLEGYVDEP